MAMDEKLTTAEILPTSAGYDLWASSYDTDGNPLIAMEEPLVDRLLGDVRGLAVLDVGCGTGRHAIRLAAAGAAVHAVDFSAAMLEQARRKAGSGEIVFGAHDLSKPMPFAGREVRSRGLWIGDRSHRGFGAFVS